MQELLKRPHKLIQRGFHYIYNVCVFFFFFVVFFFGGGGGGGGSSARLNTLVCASSEDSRESVGSLESALICADFYNSSKSKYRYILH